jgi:hypothetical protein
LRSRDAVFDAHLVKPLGAEVIDAALLHLPQSGRLTRRGKRNVDCYG